MLVRLTILRGVEMDDAVDALDVYSSCCNICSNQNLGPATAETLHRSISLALIQSTMQSCNLDSLVSQSVSNPIDTGAGSTEYDAATTLLDGIRCNRCLVVTLGHPEQMIHAVHADFLWPYLDGDWIMLVPFHKFSDLIVQSCAEENGLAFQ